MRAELHEPLMPDDMETYITSSPPSSTGVKASIYVCGAICDVVTRTPERREA